MTRLAQGLPHKTVPQTTEYFTPLFLPALFPFPLVLVSHLCWPGVAVLKWWQMGSHGIFLALPRVVVTYQLAGKACSWEVFISGEKPKLFWMHTVPKLSVSHFHFCSREKWMGAHHMVQERFWYGSVSPREQILVCFFSKYSRERWKSQIFFSGKIN